jgi:hypothetical protein
MFGGTVFKFDPPLNKPQQPTIHTRGVFLIVGDAMFRNIQPFGGVKTTEKRR